MSKRLIIVESCGECPEATFGFLMGHKRVCARMFAEERICPEEGTPDWCPLRPLPEKKQHPVRFYEDGWNACLDAIIGGKE